MVTYNPKRKIILNLGDRALTVQLLQSSMQLNN